MDNFNNSSYDWLSYIKIKIMPETKKIFFKKKILIYGLGKSGYSSYNFLRKNNLISLYDDKKNSIKNKKIKNLIAKQKVITKKKFDFIIISPGIDVDKCKLKNFLKKNYSKIITDLDVFYKYYYNNKNIVITGTNGKSTTAKILFDVLKRHKKDTRLVGNIGNPILAEKKITSKTIFVVEASSYQIAYSKFFKANYAIILNISPDHLERHGTFLNYIKSKFKLFKNQTSKDYSIFNINNKYIIKEIKTNKIKSKIIRVNNYILNKYKQNIKNQYFLTQGNKENLSFIFTLSKILNLKKNIILKTINNFKGLKYRQEIIFRSNNITLINDSKATSFSSSIGILKSLKNVFWLVGGIPKKGDKFLLTKNNCFTFKAYIFGKNKNFFIKSLKNKINFQTFKNLEDALKKILIDIKVEKTIAHKTILFSPSAASFDTYKNFEDRGTKFNKLVKKLKLKKKLYV